MDFIRQVRAGENWFSWIWRQHNEHRVIPMKLAMAALAPLTRWNTKTEMYLSVVLAGLVVLGLWRLYRRAGGTSLLLFAPVPWLVCSLSQYQNMLYGMMICHYFTLLGVVWALVFLDRSSGERGGRPLRRHRHVLDRQRPAGLAGGPGLAARPGRAPEPDGRLDGGLGPPDVALLLPFHDAPGGTPVSRDLLGLYRLASFGIAALGAPLGAGNMDWSRAAGLAVGVAILAVAWRWRRQGLAWMRGEALPGALILFAVLSCGMIAFGRAGSGIPPLESRYIAYSSFALIGVYLILGLWSRRQEVPAGRLWLAGATALLVPGLIAANLYGLRQAKDGGTCG